MKLSFTVGNTEKHLVEFSWNPFTGHSKLLVDGTIVKKTGWELASPNRPAESETKSTEETWVVHSKEIDLVREWIINVGEQEQHNVKIKKIRPTWCAGIRPHTYEIYIDHALIEKQTGY